MPEGWRAKQGIPVPDGFDLSEHVEAVSGGDGELPEETSPSSVLSYEEWEEGRGGGRKVKEEEEEKGKEDEKEDEKKEVQEEDEEEEVEVAEAFSTMLVMHIAHL